MSTWKRTLNHARPFSSKCFGIPRLHPFRVIFWFRHKGSRLTRWLALIVIMLGLNGLQIFLELTLPPPAPGTAPWRLTPAWVGVSLLNVLINSFFYYAILVVALLFNGYGQRRLVALLAAPIAVTYLFGIDVWVNELNYHLIAAWGALYWLAAAGNCWAGRPGWKQPSWNMP